MAKLNETKNAAFRIPPALIVFVVLVLAVVVTAVTLYPVAREYYIADRENIRLNAEQQALIERNGKIRDQIDELGTPTGIENRAREEFGWVKEGEEAVNITGLGATTSSTRLPATIEPGSVEVPKTWWTETLDEFFGLEESVPVNPYSDDTIPGL
jgi:cell division protein FtsB